IAEKVRAGLTAFKLKTGVNIELAVARLAVLRETAGPRASLNIDPNGGSDMDEAIRNIKRLERFDLAGVETPVAGADPQDLATVRQNVRPHILEHVNTPEQALNYLHHNSVDAFNLSIAGCRGIWPARQVAQLAEAGKVGTFPGSTVELGPG